MDLRIKRMLIENFKGIKKKELIFDGKDVIVKGANGTGKSSCAMVLGWIINGCDLNMNKEPNITPLGENECVSRAEVELMVDGKTFTIAKSQKYKSKEEDGKISSSVTNTYEINSVAKSYKDFVSSLKDRQIDVDHFQILSNPNAFMNDTSKKGREEMRKVLFRMASDLSDNELLDEIKDVSELKALLEEGYTIEEAEASNKATIKKINEIMGKDNCIAQGRIQGILDSKSNLNAETLKKAREQYETELEQISAKLRSLLDSDSKAKAEIAQLEGELIVIENAERRKIDDKVDKAVHKLMAAQSEANDKKADMIHAKGEMEYSFSQIDGVKESLENYRKIYAKVQNETFDENTTKCPSCGRSFAKNKIDEMKTKFEKSKSERMADCKNKGETYKKQLTKLENDYTAKKDAYELAEKEWKAADDKVSKLDEENHGISRVPDLSKVKEYIDIQNKIKELRAILQAKGDLELQELSSRESYLKQMIRQVDGEMAVLKRNAELDEQVRVIRNEIKQSETNKAHSEKILDQIERFKRYKDDKLSLEINQYFQIVNWHLSEFQRNGERKEICEPYIGDKSLFSHSNQALQVVSKCDIIRGLSKFSGNTYPVFIDDASLLTKESIKQIDMPNQIIWLCAENGYPELEVTYDD